MLIPSQRYGSMAGKAIASKDEGPSLVLWNRMVGEHQFLQLFSDLT